jgi:sialic acid synthase SpsE
MFSNLKKKIKIISEIHPQHHGSMDELERMVLQSKIAGADYIKLQLYDSFKLFGDNDRKYLEINEKELEYIKLYCENIGIEIFCSVFSEDKLKWCEKLNFKLYKIASRSVEDKQLCEKILSLNKTVLISLGMYDWQKKGFPYGNTPNIKYMYCISKYPSNLQEVNMPNFNENGFHGYSDHTVGISACIYAATKGAQYVEKHFSCNKSLNVSTEQAHICSMDFDDLTKMREILDSISLLKN